MKSDAMDNEPHYLIRQRKQVVNCLTELRNKQCLISVQFGEYNQAFLTVILEIDDKKNELKLDSAPTEQLNRQLLNASAVLFCTEIDGIKVSFRGSNIKRSQSGELPALAMEVPDAIFWLQRRDSYRIKVPQSHIGSYCQFTLNLENEDGATYLETQDFKLLDIGIRGLAILNPYATLDHHFVSNRDPIECTLYLHEKNYDSVSLTFKYMVDVKTGFMMTQKRIGCHFTRISLSFESSIQRYMQDVERQISHIG
ncbi:MAG TPA: flagellar brake protein [Methylobacter sp.]|jgi:c-di-GMP-binding flagellar brake protein YcgR